MLYRMCAPIFVVLLLLPTICAPDACHYFASFLAGCAFLKFYHANHFSDVIAPVAAA